MLQMCVNLNELTFRKGYFEIVSYKLGLRRGTSDYTYVWADMFQAILSQLCYARLLVWTECTINIEEIGLSLNLKISYVGNTLQKYQISLQRIKTSKAFLYSHILKIYCGYVCHSIKQLYRLCESLLL